MKKKVVCLDYSTSNFDIEKSVLGEVADVVCSPTIDEATLIDLCRDAHGILSNRAQISRRVIENLKNCQIISRYGVGLDNIDVVAAKEKGIIVTNCPVYCVEEVSDVAMAMTLALFRQTLCAHQSVLNDVWNVDQMKPIRSIQGKTVGILGFGKIAQAFTRKIRSFLPEKILVLSAHLTEKEAKEHGVILSDADEIFSKSDVISIHLPLSENTRSFVDKKRLSQMKKDAFLINTGRGAVISEPDLVEALQNKTIGGAGLDVFTNEPIPKDSPFKKLDNVVLCPHLAWYSVESLERLKRIVSTDVLLAITGQTPQNIV